MGVQLNLFVYWDCSPFIKSNLKFIGNNQHIILYQIYLNENIIYNLTFISIQTRLLPMEKNFNLKQKEGLNETQ
jgi:hypothetical protein